jgi:hypothetical protein
VLWISQYIRGIIVLAKISEDDRVEDFGERIRFNPSIGPYFIVMESGCRSVYAVWMDTASGDAVDLEVLWVVGVVCPGVVECW